VAGTSEVGGAHPEQHRHHRHLQRWQVVKYAGCIPIQAVDQELKDVRAYQQKTGFSK